MVKSTVGKKIDLVLEVIPPVSMDFGGVAPAFAEPMYPTTTTNHAYHEVAPKAPPPKRGHSPQGYVNMTPSAPPRPAKHSQRSPPPPVPVDDDDDDDDDADAEVDI